MTIEIGRQNESQGKTTKNTPKLEEKYELALKKVWPWEKKKFSKKRKWRRERGGEHEKS